MNRRNFIILSLLISSNLFSMEVKESINMKLAVVGDNEILQKLKKIKTNNLLLISNNSNFLKKIIEFAPKSVIFIQNTHNKILIPTKTLFPEANFVKMNSNIYLKDKVEIAFRDKIIYKALLEHGIRPFIVDKNLVVLREFFKLYNIKGV